jgi:hypothetical protein
MSLRFRKSMKLLPGVRLNFSKETVGLSNLRHAKDERS